MNAEDTIRQLTLRLDATRAELEASQRIARLGSWELDLSNLEDLGANPLRWSAEVYRIFGFQPGEIEVTNQLFFERVHPDDRAAISENVRRALDDRAPYGIDHRVRLPDGSVRWVHERSEVLRDAGGRPVRMLGTVQDVTEQREAEHAVSRSEERLRLALVAGRMVAWELDAASQRLVLSQNAPEILGVPAEIPDPRGLRQRVHPDDRPNLEALALAGSAPRPEIVQFRFQRPDNGEWVWLEARAELGHDTGGGLAVRGVAADISDRKRAEVQQARAMELELISRKNEEANRLKSTFLANVSHELRTPLSAIIGLVEVLRDDRIPTTSAERDQFLDDIWKSGRLILRLINELLDLSKIEAGRLELRPEPVELPRVIAEVMALIRSQAREREVQLHTELDESLGEIYLDSARLKQVLLNYLSNALKFSPPGAEVSLRVAALEDDRLRLEVQDRGPGIALQDQPRLFTEFGQLDGRSGTGLGLALTKRLVEAQGGSVGVISAPGEGSTFFAILPRQATPTQRRAT